MWHWIDSVQSDTIDLHMPAQTYLWALHKQTPHGD